MIETIQTRPTNPKNGAKYKNKDGKIFIFRNGTWVKQKIK